MFVTVLAAETDDTRSAITFLIVCLIGIAVLLSLLTVWYWRFTSPRRRLAEAAAPAVIRAPVPVSAGPEDLVIDPGQPQTGSPAHRTPPRGRPVKPRLRPVEVDPVHVAVAEQVGAAGDRVGVSTRIEVEERGRPAPASTPEPNSEPTPASEPVPAPVPAVAAVTLVLEPRSTSRVAAPARPGTHLDVRSPGEAAPVTDPAADDQAPALSDDAWAAAMRSAFDRLNAGQ